MRRAAQRRVDRDAAEGDRREDAGRSGVPLAPAHTDWVRNRLTVSGPAGEVARFRAAARGTGGIPWHLDLEHEEARLLAPMAAAGPEARALARALRETLAVRHARVLARWHERGTCPLDLHRLVPIPPRILELGEDAPEAIVWLWARWGTVRPLRQVRLIEANADKRLRRTTRLVFEFWSADWTPWQAIRRVRQDWPTLVLVVAPRYDDG